MRSNPKPSGPGLYTGDLNDRKPPRPEPGPGQTKAAALRRLKGGAGGNRKGQPKR